VLSSGLRIDAVVLPKKPLSDSSIWLVPGLGLSGADAVMERFARPDAARAIEALRTQAEAGGIVAAACSAVFLLHEAGLIIEKRVTTTWWLGGLLQRLQPRCVVDVNQMVVADGNIVTGEQPSLIWILSCICFERDLIHYLLTPCRELW
jgi:transcriptional regulator GlxA family with amidase domain